MEGDSDKIAYSDDCGISIHTLRMEGDPPLFILCPVGHLISIHTLRMEGDYSTP